MIDFAASMERLKASEVEMSGLGAPLRTATPMCEGNSSRGARDDFPVLREAFDATLWKMTRS